MGSKPSVSIPNRVQFDQESWEEDAYLTNQLNQIDCGEVQVLRNYETEEVLQKYQLQFINKQEMERYVQSFKFRTEQQHIVKPIHLIPNVKKDYCSTIYCASVIFRHPKNRLSNFKDIPHPDNLYCLSIALQGYQKLFNQIGRFPVFQEQICIDEEGMLTVWFNRNISKNYPEDYQIDPQNLEEQEEQDTVQDIVKIICESTDPQSQPEVTFLQFFQRKKKLQRIGFDEALVLVEEYAESTDTNIPGYFVSVLEIYQDEKDMFDNINEKTQEKKSYHGEHNDSRFHRAPDILIQELAQNSDRLNKNQKKKKISQHNRSYKLSSINSSSHHIQNTIPNEYTKQPTNTYKLNFENFDNSQILKNQQLKSLRNSAVKNKSGQYYEAGIQHRLNTVEKEAAIRQEQLRRISGSQNEQNISGNQMYAEMNNSNSFYSNHHSGKIIIPLSGFNSMQGSRVGSKESSQNNIVPINAERTRNNHSQKLNIMIQNNYPPASPHINNIGNGGNYSSLKLDERGFSFGNELSRDNKTCTPLFYDTVSESVELDPEIAADLLIYI